MRAFRSGLLPQPIVSERKRTLIVGALLMLGAGVVFIVTNNILFLLVAAVIGVISRAVMRSARSCPLNRLP